MDPFRYRLEKDLRVSVEERDARAEAIIPCFEFNASRDKEEYLSLTAVHLHDRAVTMVGMNGVHPSSDPQLTLTMEIGNLSVVSGAWRDSRKERQEWLRKEILEQFSMLIKMLKQQQEEGERNEGDF